jgi:hypothetical protein
MVKRLLAIAITIALISPVTLSAQQNTTRFFIAYDYGNVTVDTTVGGVGFAAGDISGSKAQLVTFTVTCASGTDCPIRVTSDGTAPTATVGMRLNSGQSVSIYGNSNITRFRAIQESVVGAVLNTQFYQ